MKIPYGVSNFAKLRTEGYFYVDKTPFLPVLEDREERRLVDVEIALRPEVGEVGHAVGDLHARSRAHSLMHTDKTPPTGFASAHEPRRERPPSFQWTSSPSDETWPMQ